MEDNKESQEEIKQEEVLEVNPEMAKLNEELENTTDRLKRLMAEFDNFKKRNAKEREILYNSILSDIVSRVITSIG